MSDPALRIISLGAGVQSTALVLMAAHGVIGPMPDCAVFADTGWEPGTVYEHLQWLGSGNVLPFPVVTARRPGPDLGAAAIGLASGLYPRKGTPAIPLFTKGPDGMLPKQCSKEFKTRVISNYIRERFGVETGKHFPKPLRVEQWLGISWDEMQRAKDSEKPWITNRFPLLELRMRRGDCLEWIRGHGYPQPPKSACIFCPFHTRQQWAELMVSPERDRLIAFDRAIRSGFDGMGGEAFLTRDRVPIEEADFTASTAGQLEFGFQQECEGQCGV